MVQIRQLELMNSQLKNGEKYAYTKKFSHYIDNEPLPVAAQQHVVICGSRTAGLPAPTERPSRDCCTSLPASTTFY